MKTITLYGLHATEFVSWCIENDIFWQIAASNVTYQRVGKYGVPLYFIAVMRERDEVEVMLRWADHLEPREP